MRVLQKNKDKDQKAENRSPVVQAIENLQLQEDPIPIADEKKEKALMKFCDFKAYWIGIEKAGNGCKNADE